LSPYEKVNKTTVQEGRRMDGRDEEKALSGVE